MSRNLAGGSGTKSRQSWCLDLCFEHTLIPGLPQCERLLCTLPLSRVKMLPSAFPTAILYCNPLKLRDKISISSHKMFLSGVFPHPDKSQLQSGNRGEHCER